MHLCQLQLYSIYLWRKFYIYHIYSYCRANIFWLCHSLTLGGSSTVIRNSANHLAYELLNNLQNKKVYLSTSGKSRIGNWGEVFSSSPGLSVPPCWGILILLEPGCTSRSTFVRQHITFPCCVIQHPSHICTIHARTCFGKPQLLSFLISQYCLHTVEQPLLVAISHNHKIILSNAWNLVLLQSYFHSQCLTMGRQPSVLKK